MYRPPGVGRLAAAGETVAVDEASETATDAASNSIAPIAPHSIARELSPFLQLDVFLVLARSQPSHRTWAMSIAVPDRHQWQAGCRQPDRDARGLPRSRSRHGGGSRSRSPVSPVHDAVAVDVGLAPAIRTRTPEKGWPRPSRRGTSASLSGQPAHLKRRAANAGLSRAHPSAWPLRHCAPDATRGRRRPRP